MSEMRERSDHHTNERSSERSEIKAYNTFVRENQFPQMRECVFVCPLTTTHQYALLRGVGGCEAAALIARREPNVVTSTKLIYVTLLDADSGF